jgi:hypothetical protein
MKFIKSIALTTALLATSVSASQIEVDLNDNGATSTAAMDYLTINYSSHTSVDMTAIGGPLVTTYAGVNAIGVDFGFLAAPVVADFGSLVGCPSCGVENTLSGVPDFLGSGFTSEYFTSGMGLTYGISLTGSLVAGELVYTGGTLDMYSYSFLAASSDPTTYMPTKLFTTEFVSGGVYAGEQVVRTTVTNVEAAGEDTFFLTDKNQSFEDYLANALNDIDLYIVQTVAAGQLTADIAAAFSDDALNNQAGTAYVSAPHNASITFSVPEPTSIAILGLGLLGLASTKRRKS